MSKYFMRRNYPITIGRYAQLLSYLLTVRFTLAPDALTVTA
uniref:Uncharacterized protein n=1 Tax=mine drainage metagenome TaxID=410659 RepID=E6PZZ6_9ZZZZ